MRVVAEREGRSGEEWDWDRRSVRGSRTRRNGAPRLCVASGTVKDSDTDPVHESPGARPITAVGVEAARVTRGAGVRDGADLARRHAHAHQRAARQRAEIEIAVAGPAR